MVETYENTNNLALFNLELDAHFSTPLHNFEANPQNSKIIAYDHCLSLIIQNVATKSTVTIPAPVIEK